MDSFIKWILVRFLKEKMGIQNSGSLGRPHEGRNGDQKSGRYILPTEVAKDWHGGEVECWGGGCGGGGGAGMSQLVECPDCRVLVPWCLCR